MRDRSCVSVCALGKTATRGGPLDATTTTRTTRRQRHPNKRDTQTHNHKKKLKQTKKPTTTKIQPKKEHREHKKKTNNTNRRKNNTKQTENTTRTPKKDTGQQFTTVTKAMVVLGYGGSGLRWSGHLPLNLRAISTCRCEWNHQRTRSLRL